MNDEELLETMRKNIAAAIVRFGESESPSDLIRKWSMEKIPTDSLKSIVEYCNGMISGVEFACRYAPPTAVMKTEYALFKNVVKYINEKRGETNANDRTPH